LLVYIASLISAILLIIGKDLADNIVFMESLGPALRDLILDLILNKLLVWRFCESSLNGLFVELIKLVVEAGNHVLDLSTFFFSLESLNNCLLYFLGSHIGIISS